MTSAGHSGSGSGGQAVVQMGGMGGSMQSATPAGSGGAAAGTAGGYRLCPFVDKCGSKTRFAVSGSAAHRFVRHGHELRLLLLLGYCNAS